MSTGRRFTGTRLLLASHNSGKINELQALLAPRGITVTSGRELGLAEPVEDGADFAANARLKALAAVRAIGLPALADDSGLAVAALDGAPGLHSARWAGPERDFGAAMRRVLDALAGLGPEARGAAFIAVLCLAWPDGHVELARGEVRGVIAAAPRGTGGFGYDPIFQPEGESGTFGELGAEAKAALSHRARALRVLLARCFAAA